MRLGPFGIWEIMIILIVVLLVFGPRRLPELAKGVGQSVRAFRKEMRGLKEDVDTESPTATRAERAEERTADVTAPSPAGAAPAAPPTHAPGEVQPGASIGDVPGTQDGGDRPAS